MSSVGERLVRIRKEKKMNQVSFAQLLHISRSQLGNLETGKREINEQTLHILCSEFNVNEKWLLTGEGKPYNQAVIDSIELSDSARGLHPTDPDGDKKSDMFQYASMLLHQFKKISYSCENIEEFLSFFSYPTFADQIGYILSVYSDALHDPVHSLLTLKLFNSLFEKTFDLANESKRLKLCGKKRSETFEKDDLTDYAEGYYREILDDVFDISEPTRPISGLAAGGTPLFDEGDSEETVAVPQKYLDRDHYFIIKVKGDSMEPRIMDGDYVVVERNAKPAPGEVSLVRVVDSSFDEGYVIKRYSPTDTGVDLRSFNPSYPTMHYSLSDLRSAERIVHVIHRNQ